MIKTNRIEQTIKDQIDYEYNRIKGDKEAQHAFFGEALAIQNKAWDIEYADERLEMACDVLSICGYCNSKPCDRCQLIAANKQARDDIQLGLRKHPKEKTESNLRNASIVCEAVTNFTNPHIKDVIYNGPATIVFWSDNTKTVVVACNEPMDKEKGLAMAIAKKALGNKGKYYNEFKKWLKEDE